MRDRQKFILVRFSRITDAIMSVTGNSKVVLLEQGYNDHVSGLGVDWPPSRERYAVDLDLVDSVGISADIA